MISSNHGSLEEIAESGQLHLERLSFAEAEAAFGHVLEELTSSCPHGDRLRMTSLVGLAEIRARRCRDVIDDVDEWLRGMLYAVALYKEATEIAETKAGVTDRKRNNSGAGNRTIDNDVRYFEEVLQKSSVHAKVLENDLVEVVKREVTAMVARTRADPGQKKMEDFDFAWLQKLVECCCVAGGRPHEDNQPDNRDNNGRRQRTNTTTETTDRDNDNSSGRRQQKTKAIETTDKDNRDNNDEELTVSTTTVEEKTMFESSCSHAPGFRRRIDYDLLQEGIRRIVGGVSVDVRGQYRHFRRRVPSPAMQKRLFHELVLRLSPGYRESDDLAEVLEDAVQYEDCSVVAKREDVESRKIFTEEILLRAAEKNWKEEEEVEESESLEWGESWEKEEKVRREDYDREKEEEEEDEDDDDVETTELRLLPSAVHTAKVIGMKRKCPEPTSDERNAFSDANFPSLSGSLTTREAGLRTVRSIQSKIRTPDFKTGTSTGSGEVGGPSGGILTLWRSTRVKVDSAYPQRSGSEEHHNFEEVSSPMDHGKVLRWLQSVQSEPWSKSSNRDRIVGPTTTHPSGDRVGQVVGHVVLRVGDSFRKERAYLEAHEMYKYAMGVFQRFPLPRGQTQVMVDLMLRVGAAKCSMGQVATGSRMMEEAVGMVERGEGDAFKVAELWFQVGNVYLTDRMRRESLQARVMQLIREDIEAHAEEEQGVDDDKSSECDSSDSEECHSYCVCIYEALNSYRKALSVLDFVGDTRFPELVIGIVANMADCYVMTGNLDRAEASYERALRLFPAALGSQLIARNAHVLSMLGTINFLLGNHIRASTMYETASILLQSTEDTETTLEAAWTATMLGLSHSVLLRLDKAAVWCARAFAAYTRFFRGRILDVDPLNQWFIVRTLLVLGTSLGANDKALYYLNLARNMTTLGRAGNDGDLRHLVKVLTAIANVYVALGRPDKARAYREEALEYGRGIVEDGKKYGDDLGMVFQRQGDVKGDMVETLLRLGTASTLNCDLEKAIGCYSDVLDAFGDTTIDARHDVAGVMASLGTLCHVKDYMRDGDDVKDSWVNKAERHFEEAFQLAGSTSPACVQYANFLYRRGRYADALTVMLPYVFCSRPVGDRVCYSGIEQVVLPDHLHHHHHIEEQDTLVMEARIFACFLATLCYNCLGLNRDADDALAQLYRLAIPSTKSLDHVMLGYGLMERGLFEEAAGSFVAAARLQSSAGCSRRTFNKARLCFLLVAYLTVARAVDFLLEFVYDRSVRDRYSSTFDEQRHYLRAASSSSSRGVSSPQGAVATRAAIRITDLDEWKTEEEIVVVAKKSTPPEIILESISRPNRSYDLESPLNSAMEEDEKEEEKEEQEEWEEWTTEETVVIKTPPEILNLVDHNLNGTAYQRRYDPLSVIEPTGGEPDRTDTTTAFVNAAVYRRKWWKTEARNRKWTSCRK